MRVFVLRKINIIYPIFIFLLVDTLYSMPRRWNPKDFSENLAYYQELKSSTSLMDIASLYRSSGSYEKALTVLEKNISAVDSLILLDYAQIAYLNADFYSSGESYSDLLSNDKENYDLLLGLAAVRMAQKKYSDAIKLLKKAIQINKRPILACVYMARCQEKKGRIEKAIKYYKTALKYDSHMIELRYALGRLYKKNKSYIMAYREYKKINSVDSKCPIAKKNIAKLIKKVPEKKRRKVKTKDYFSKKRPVAEKSGIPIIRVGLNTTHRGKILRFKEIIFRAAYDFNISSKNNILFEGSQDKDYKIYIENAKALILDGDQKIPLTDDFRLVSDSTATASFILRAMEYARGFAWAGIEDREYRGIIHVSLSSSGFKLINELNLEEYLYSVVPSEMMISYPKEALKAQAVIARTYAYYRYKILHPHQKADYDLCDSQHCQVFKGVANEWKKTNEAVDSTRGELLYYKDKITQPLFHSNCGGHTQNSSDLKGWGTVSYLKAVYDGPASVKFPESPYEFERWIKDSPSVYCRGGRYGWMPEHRWLRVIPYWILDRKLNREYSIGKLKNIKIIARNPSGHVDAVRVEGSKKTVLIEKEHKIRRNLGAGPLRSNLFWLESVYDEQGDIKDFIIYGGGWGHGIGMCQTGAAGLADAGYDYKKILQHYYKNTHIKNIGY